MRNPVVAYSNPSKPELDCALVASIPPAVQEEYVEPITASTPKLPENPLKLSKQAIRSSLKASTIDGVFSIIFSSITGGVLLSNFLLQLGASSVEIGMLSSFPMLVNLLQPLGAYVADRMTSRHWYILSIFTPSRLSWLILVLGIWLVSQGGIESHQLIGWTLAIVFITHVMGALGSPAWVSWMAVLVPRRLRGRYFGLRNSAASLTTLLCVPLLGLAVSTWPGGIIQGYGVLLLLGVLFGVISLGCQFFIADVNPQQQGKAAGRQVSKEVEKDQEESVSVANLSHAQPITNYPLPITDNFWWFLLYFSLWTFAVNVSNPFFNLYMLDNLAIDVSWVTIYSSLMAGANLLMLLLWGKLADRIGNRPILLLVGIVVAVTPLFWLVAGSDSISLWVWLPLLHVLGGGTWAAIDLCSNNMQMDVAPTQNQASYFAIAAAVSGVCGALGTTAGGFLAQFADYGGLPGLFVLSSVLRLVALLPLFLIQERCRQSLRQLMQNLHQSIGTRVPLLPQPVPVPATELLNRSK
jgi:MFS family permease